MSQIKHLESDLGYVRDALRKSGHHASPPAIYFLWAVIIAVGFPLADFAQQYVGVFWTVAGPVGGVVSWILGWRHSVKHGQVSRALGVRYGLHWLGTMVAIFLVVPLGVTGSIAWSAAHRLILLIIALGYFLAGVHLERPLLWIGVLMVLGYLLLFTVSAYGWTIVGALVAVALVATPLVGGRSRDARTG